MPSPWDDVSKIEQLRVLWPEGLSVAEIAKRLNVTHGAVTSKAHRIGLEPRRNPAGTRPLPKLTNTLPLIVGRRGPVARTTLPTLESTVGVTVGPVAVGYRCAPECCWPVTNGRPWRFCDAPTVPGNRYCAKHRQVSMYGKAAEAIGAVPTTTIVSAATGAMDQSSGESPGMAATTLNVSESSHVEYASVVTSDENTAEMDAFAD